MTAAKPRRERHRRTAWYLTMVSLLSRQWNCPIPLASIGVAGITGRDGERPAVESAGSQRKSTASSSVAMYVRTAPGIAQTTHASQHCSSASRSVTRAHHADGCHQ